jgi:hypothetical protein
MASHTACWGDHTRPPTHKGTPATRRRYGCAAKAQHAKDAQEEGPQRRPCAAGGWRNPLWASCVARIVRATPSGCRTIRANRYSLTIRTAPSTMQTYQNSIP